MGVGLDTSVNACHSFIFSAYYWTKTGPTFIFVKCFPFLHLGRSHAILTRLRLDSVFTGGGGDVLCVCVAGGKGAWLVSLFFLTTACNMSCI